MSPEEARGVLGVDATADFDALKTAFRFRTRVMHPDRFASRPDSEQEFATKEFQRLTAAFETLKDVTPQTPQDGTTHTSSGSPTRGADMQVEFRDADIRPGRVITIDKPDGKRVTIRIPATRSAENVVRVQQKGWPGESGGTNGDLYVKLIQKLSFQRFVNRRDAEDWGLYYP